MRTSIIIALACQLLVAAPTQAQKAHTPSPGDPERHAILEAARPHVAKDLGYRGRLLFKVNTLLVSGDWALLQGQPVAPSGARLHKNCVEADDVTLVLLQRRKGTWHIERGGTTCATDVFWLEWQAELGAPAEIFVFDESEGAD
jgi:hypothetical protein